MTIETMPRNTIWVGVATAAVGALLVILAPQALNTWWAPNTNDWQTAAMVFDAVLTIARLLLMPLGAALIAGGLVMRYVDARIRGESVADRPRRWRFPDASRSE
ncbi:hypothetical protein [Agromyces sp. LHK192]|uniref:hypothetical protein n=1 Tax=Agromyces sp. LHK192 TaxID=2498704 RepID=UPI000FD7DDF8|nr:hypothetical protein [Agromyces sp. LHK192]